MRKILTEGSPEAQIWRTVGGGRATSTYEESFTTVQELNVNANHQFVNRFCCNLKNNNNIISCHAHLQKRLEKEPIFKGALMECKRNGWVEVIKGCLSHKHMQERKRKTESNTSSHLNRSKKWSDSGAPFCQSFATHQRSNSRAAAVCIPI